MVRDFDGISPTLGAGVYIDPQASVIGKVTLGDQSSVWPMAVLRGDVNSITIGARCSVQDGSVLHVTHDHPEVPGGHPLVIGDEVTIGHNVNLHGCTIEERCLIGIGAIVLDGAVIEKHSLLGAGTLVPPGKRLESGYLWMGSPAKKVRALTEEEIEKLGYSAGHYVRLIDKYLDNV